MQSLEKKRLAQNKYQRKLAGAKNPSGEDNRGPCEICRRVPGADQQANSYDHDHVTGEFRGWLCHGCNAGLGHFRDSVQSLQSAIDYLSKRS